MAVHRVSPASRRDLSAGVTPGTPVASDPRTHKVAAYETLRDMIVLFELPPGERLVELDLADRLGVSKTPVRQAIALLEAHGLVEMIPYRGAVVRWLSRTEMAEQSFLVDALEMPVYPTVVARITRAELVAIDKLGGDLVRARRARDELRYGELVVRIHLALFACARYPRLLELIRLVVGPVGLRYDKALVYPFDESWDELLGLALGRVEAVHTRDPAVVRDTVVRRRRRLADLNETHLGDPAVARYFLEH